MLFAFGYAENAWLNHGHLERGVDILIKTFAADVLACRVRALVVGAWPFGLHRMMRHRGCLLWGKSVIKRIWQYTKKLTKKFL